tara:strand:+ start:147 stop:725 length:579 start_codon:yes stop_codon:yes gene_type:complete
MRERISELTDKIDKLERQLLDELDKLQKDLNYRLEGKRVKFEQNILDKHRKLKSSILPWLLASSIRNILSAPFIYSMVFPIAFFDLTITLYQHICFRLYGIRRVERAKYIVLDRHQLAYLNGIEKLNCVYCGYGNGVVAYTREVLARTEQYWCPIKHARRVVGSHRHYNKFANYGDSDHYKEQLIKMRDELR